MADDKPEDAGLAPESGRARRAAPTIDLEATEVSTQPQQSAGEAQPEPESAQADPEQAEPEPTKAEPESVEAQAAVPPVAAPPAPVSPWVIAPFSGAVAAALVIAVGWMLGWPAVQAPPAAPQVTAATVEALNGRVASVEAKVGKPAADPAAMARIDALEKSLVAVRGDVAGLRAQSDKLAGALKDVKAAPRDASSAPGLAAVTERIAQLEHTIKAERAELAQQGAKIADAKPADDKPLRRVVAASLLDVAVRHGDPYAAQLAAARSFAADPDALKPLDAFTASAIPSPLALSRELLEIVPKLSPPAEAQTSGTGIVDRLQSGAARLVRIERTDGAGNDRGAIAARVTAAALRNDFNEARRLLKTMPEADRAPAQAWLDKAAARDAALAASRKFADDAMADLAKSSP